METDIWFQGKLQPSRKTPIISFGGVDLEEYLHEDDIQVLSIE